MTRICDAAQTEIDDITNGFYVKELDSPRKGYSVFVVPDNDAESPRDWGCNVARFSHDHRDYADWNECSDLDAIVRNTIRSAVVEECWAQLEIVAAEEFDFGTYGEATGFGVVYRDKATKEGLYTVDPDAILERGEDIWAPAKAALHAEIENYRRWSRDGAYGVIVVDHRNGNDESLWGIYDDPWTKTGEDYYLHTAKDLIRELQHRRKIERKAA